MKLDISSNKTGFCSTVTHLYKENPEVTINFLESFGKYMNCDYDATYLEEYVKLFKFFEKNNVPDKHLNIVKESMNECVKNLLNKRSSTYGCILSDRDIVNLHKVFGEIPTDLKTNFARLFVKSFAYVYKNRSSYDWNRSYKCTDKLTKTAYKEVMHNLLEEKHIDIYEFLERAAYALPLSGLREYACKYTDKGLEDPKILDILKDVPEFCHLTYKEEDMKNASKRRALLRRATNPDAVVKNRLRFMVTFSVEDIRGINIENRWEFLSKYYGFQNRVPYYGEDQSLSIKGYGPKIKLNRDPTYDEIEQLLFPILISGYEKYSEPCRRFIQQYAEFCENKDKKIAKKKVKKRKI